MACHLARQNYFQKIEIALHNFKTCDPAKAVEMTGQNFSFLNLGKVIGIRFKTLAKICEALDCQPGDILETAAT